MWEKEVKEEPVKREAMAKERDETKRITRRGIGCKFRFLRENIELEVGGSELNLKFN